MDKMDRSYSNYVISEVSNFDVCLKFGVRNRDLVEKDSFDTVAEIFMSPQHLKALAIMLMNDVKVYEEQFGEIQIKPLQKPSK